MLSVIIATHDSERALVPTLAALVPGATSALVSEVILADGGSSDDTAKVADIAGCKFMLLEGPLGRRLQAASAAARAPWLLFLRAGTVPDTAWVSEVQSFIERRSQPARAAVFRRTAPAPANIRDAFGLFAVALGARPQPEQGLIIASEFYRELGGHAESSANPEADLIRRIGRRRIVTLAAGVFSRRLDT